MANTINNAIKYKNLYLLEQDDKLLISDNIKLKRKKNIFKLLEKIQRNMVLLLYLLHLLIILKIEN